MRRIRCPKEIKEQGEQEVVDIKPQEVWRCEMPQANYRRGIIRGKVKAKKLP